MRCAGHARVLTCGKAKFNLGGGRSFGAGLCLAFRVRRGKTRRVLFSEYE